MKEFVIKSIKYLDKQSKSFLVITGLVVVLFLGVIRYLTGPDFAFSIFYLLPICIITWFLGEKAGIMISITCAIVWLFADLSVEYTYSHPLIPYLNEMLRLSVFFVIVYILSSLKNALEREKILATTDFLTKIANRRAFFELVSIEIDRSRRYKRPFTVIYMDLDNFKTVNDHIGHQTGDTLLCLVADILRKDIRTTDLVARIGGDEFIIFLPETEVESVQAMLQRIHKDLLDIMHKNGWPVTFSIGVVTFNIAPDTIEEVIKKADTLMYSAKQNSDNKIMQEVVDQIVTSKG